MTKWTVNIVTSLRRWTKLSKKKLSVAIKEFIENESMGTDQANSERPEQPNPRDQPSIKYVYDPERTNPVAGSAEINETAVAKTVVGADLYKVSSVIHGRIPGEAEVQPKTDQVPQEPGQSTEKPVEEPEQER